MKRYYYGIDVGGMSVKGGIINEFGEVVYKTVSPIEKNSALVSIDNVVSALRKYAAEKNLPFNSAGIGVPCIFNKKTGVVSYGNNLDFKGVNLRKYFSEKFNLKLTIANDADAALVGEYYFGAGKGYNNVALITIGTGIGGAFIHNGKLLTSETSCFGEIGHTVIMLGGKKCACGQNGCMEAYCSMPALYGQIRRAMFKNKKSLLWEKININDIDGKTFFAYIEKDETAKKVYRQYIEYLGTGIVNVANVFRPEIILLGGGVSAQKERLILPLKEYLNEHLFAKEYTDEIEIAIATNGNDAGIIGAAALTI